LLPHALSLAHLGFLEQTPLDFVSIASEAGFASVSVRAQAASAGGIEYGTDLKSDVYRRLARHLKHNSVRILGLEVISLNRNTDFGKCQRMFDLAAFLGAKRISAFGDDVDLDLITDRFARLCEMAKPYGVNIDLEFMPFRPISNFQLASIVVERAGEENGFIMLDALHLFRSGATIEEMSKTSLKRVGTFHLCDGHLLSPPSADLAREAREGRLLPGYGDFPLQSLLELLPSHVEIAVEAPFTGSDNLSVRKRADLTFAAAKAVLENVTKASGDSA
jgi:sugar phosphate isomerase/epimerase